MHLIEYDADHARLELDYLDVGPTRIMFEGVDECCAFSKEAVGLLINTISRWLITY